MAKTTTTSKIKVKTKSVKSKPATSVASELKADIYNVKGEKVGNISLPKEVFGVKVNTALIAQAIRVYMENHRQGTRKAQTRGETTGSTRKIYRQKGTGRARHGDIKAPIFVGGGVAHGPRIKDFHLDFSKNMKKSALFNALTQKFQSDGIKFINNLDNFNPKTRDMVTFLKSMVLTDNKKQKSLLLVTEKTENSIYLASRNLPYFEVTQVSQLNPYQVMRTHKLLFLKNALNHFNPKPRNIKQTEVVKLKVLKVKPAAGRKTKKVNK